MPTAKEIMTRDPITLDVDVTAEEAIRQLVELRFSAAPVLKDGVMVGIVSELELFDVLFDPTLRDATLAEFMTPDAVSVLEDTSHNKVAHLFALHRIRRVPVLRDGVPVGVVSRRDLLKFASQCDEPLVDPLSELMTCCDEA